ncbi:MAG: GNAT family N-acetyltransferase [Armatimonadetes bacterium]|nr:GNAT family N-acetyltransferase [Armatimonadota bacterium]
MAVQTGVVVEDAWLGAALGRPAYRVTFAEGIARHVGDQADAFYYARVDTDRVAEVARLCAVGFYVVDTAVTFDRPVGHPAPSSLPVRDCTPDDAEAVLHIAASCFRFSRFHLDPLIKVEVANQLKRSWVRSCLDGKRGEHVLVALVNDRPAGFLAVLRDGPRAVIDLIGVAPEGQRAGVGAALMAAFVDKYSEVEVLRVGTQVANVPSTRFYEKSGFRLCGSQYVLHLHAREGKPVRP